MNASRSKCHGTDCPIREDCLRFTATPHPTDQWYTYPEHVGHECSEFIRNARMLPPPRPGEDHPPYNARGGSTREAHPDQHMATARSDLRVVAGRRDVDRDDGDGDAAACRAP